MAAGSAMKKLWNEYLARSTCESSDDGFPILEEVRRCDLLSTNADPYLTVVRDWRVFVARMNRACGRQSAS